MHIIAVTIGFIVFVAGALYIQQSNGETTLEISGVSPMPSVTETPTVQPTITIAYDKPTVTNTPTISPTLAPISQPQNFTSYQYPNSQIISRSDDRLKLESSDDPGKITDWYKTLIKQKDMNVQSFVTTSTNGEVLNKLAAANGQEKIEISIEKKASETTTTIEV